MDTADLPPLPDLTAQARHYLTELHEIDYDLDCRPWRIGSWENRHNAYAWRETVLRGLDHAATELAAALDAIDQADTRAERLTHLAASLGHPALAAIAHCVYGPDITTPTAPKEPAVTDLPSTRRRPVPDSSHPGYAAHHDAVYADPRVTDLDGDARYTGETSTDEGATWTPMPMPDGWGSVCGGHVQIQTAGALHTGWDVVADGPVRIIREGDGELTRWTPAD